jgi:hypothetical protein
MNQGPWVMLGWLLVAIIAVLFGPILIYAALLVIGVPTVALAAIAAAIISFVCENPALTIVVVLIAAYAALVRAQRRQATQQGKPSPLTPSVDEFVAELRRRAKPRS